MNTEEKCERIEDAQRTKNISITNDKQRQSLYWLLVFPNCIEFQTDIFTPELNVNENGTELEKELVTFILDKKKRN